MKNDNRVMLGVLRQLELIKENNLELRGGRGYGANHPYQNMVSQGRVKRVYGKSYYDIDGEYIDDDMQDEADEEISPSPKKVKISKAFTNDK